MILTCPCGKKLRVPDGTTGAARCPACQARIPIPAAEPEPLHPPPPRSRPDDDTPRPPRRRPADDLEDDDRPRRKGPPPADGAKKSNALPMIFAGCALLLFLGCSGVIGGYFVFFHGKGGTTTVSTEKGGSGGSTAAAPREFKGHEDTVNTLAFSKDGVLLVSGSRDKTLRIWDVASAAQKSSLEHPAGFVWTAVWTSEGRVVTTSGDGRDGGGKLSWIDPVTGTFRKDITVNKGNVRPLAVTADGKRLGWIKGAAVEVIPAGVDAPPGPPVGYAFNVYDTQHMAFTPDGKKLVMVSNSGGSEWNLDPTVKPRPFKDSVQDTTGVSVAGNGLYAIGTCRGVVTMIEPTTLTLKENVRDLPSSGAYGAAASADGKYVASGIENGVRFFDPKTRLEVGRVGTPAGVKFQATCVAFSPDGTKIAAGGGSPRFTGENPKNYSIYLWDVTAMSPPPKKN